MDFDHLEEDFHALQGIHSPLREWRKRGWDRFVNMGLPSNSDESFRHLPLKNCPTPKIATSIQETSKKEGTHLLFSNGFFQGSIAPQGVTIISLDEAVLKFGIFLQNWFTKSLKEEKDPMAHLNTALHGKGAFLYVPPGVVIDEPLMIHHDITTTNMALSHLKVVLGKGASLKLMQKTNCLEKNAFANLFLDVSMDMGSSLFFGDQGMDSKDAVCWSASRFSLKKDSNLHFFSAVKGSKLSRQYIDVKLLDTGANALIQGMAKLSNKEHLHTKCIVEHLAPTCVSRQHFKKILDDESRASFGGKIFVRKEAQKTEGYQLSNNLILKDSAKAYATPGLEIFADDVKASHGATFTNVSEDDLFYLNARGIPEDVAKKMLIKGFTDEIWKDIPSFFPRGNS